MIKYFNIDLMKKNSTYINDSHFDEYGCTGTNSRI